MEEIKEKYLEKIKEVQNAVESLEERHYSEDKLLCELLTELGYKEIVEQYKSTAKYYL